MRKLSWLGVLLGVFIVLGGFARADEPAPSAIEWQAVIAGQIQAFRLHDAPGALRLAGKSFHVAYPDPEAFYSAIIGMGYAPIAQSRSQSFGPYRLVAPDMVLQQVELVGNDSTVYEALYQLAREPDGW
ncbi:MAG TPA: DUF4864 domain-containing protein, partial [Devosia sp.]|nr:DUF4864 domain-containing protein [Devosia sp.]